MFWLEAPERPAAATSWKRHGIDAGIRPRALAAGDIDGDGDPEVVVAEFVASEKSEQAHRAFIFERAGDGSWERAELGGPSFPLGSLDAIDVSGDGRLDLIGHGFPQPVISFYENATRR